MTDALREDLQTTRRPELYVFFDARVDWFEFGDELPRLDGDSELLADFRQVEVQG